jgi:hypothetical protein
MKSGMKHRVSEEKKAICVLRKIWKGEGMSKYVKIKRSMYDVIVVPTL